jgi:hypothetical protein
MKLDDQALPLTRRQLEGAAQRDALGWAIRRALQEAEPVSAAFFEADGQVFQRAIDYSDVELAFYDLSCSRLPVQEANQLASSICTPMPFAGPLFKFALFRTRPGEFYGPFPTAFFGSLHDFVDFELEDQASNDYLEDGRCEPHHPARLWRRSGADNGAALPGLLRHPSAFADPCQRRRAGVR